MGQTPSSGAGTGAHATTTPSPPALSAHDKAVMELKVTRDRLQKYQKRNAQEAQVLVEKARSLLKEGRRDRAATALRMKKLKEREVERAEAQLFSVQELLMGVERAEITVQVVEGLKQGNEALRRLNALMPVDEVRAVLEETEEHQQRVDELNRMLAESLDPVAEEEALKELGEIAAEVAATDPRLRELPTAPQHPIQVPASAAAAETPPEPAPAKARVAVPV